MCATAGSIASSRVRARRSTAACSSSRSEARGLRRYSRCCSARASSRRSRRDLLLRDAARRRELHRGDAGVDSTIRRSSTAFPILEHSRLQDRSVDRHGPAIDPDTDDRVAERRRSRHRARLPRATFSRNSRTRRSPRAAYASVRRIRRMAISSSTAIPKSTTCCSSAAASGPRLQPWSGRFWRLCGPSRVDGRRCRRATLCDCR